jgi:hypothetical protein
MSFPLKWNRQTKSSKEFCCHEVDLTQQVARVTKSKVSSLSLKENWFSIQGPLWASPQCRSQPLWPISPHLEIFQIQATWIHEKICMLCWKLSMKPTNQRRRDSNSTYNRLSHHYSHLNQNNMTKTSYKVNMLEVCPFLKNDSSSLVEWNNTKPKLILNIFG